MILTETISGRDFFKGAKTVETPSGKISYVEKGTGPVALFVHGILVNGYLWRHQLQELSDIRRCIAPDILAHGRTEIKADQDVSMTANAHMLKEFLDALKIDQVDLVGNDTAGAICQIFAAHYPERVRTITLTDCDTHDNYPPPAFQPFCNMVNSGGLKDMLEKIMKDKNVFRDALAPAYEHPQAITDATIETYMKPHTLTAQRTHDLERFVGAFDTMHTVSIESKLKEVKAPALIVWGDDDVYFDVKWSEWLERALTNTKERVVLKGARVFFLEERYQEFNKLLRKFWT